MNRLVAAALVCVVVGSGCGKKIEAVVPTVPVANTASAAPSALTIDPTDLAIVSSTSLRTTVEATGTLKAVRQVIVKTKTAGEVIELSLLEGQSVKKGQAVARIDEQESGLRLNERQAQSQSAKAQLDLAKRTFDNQQQLFQKGFISQAALDNAQTQLNVAAAAFDSANATLAIAKKGVSDSKLTSPINGVVAERYVQLNEKVGLDARIMLIVDDTSLELEALLQVADAGKLSAGSIVSVKPEGSDTASQGTITRINPATATGTRLVPVHIAITNQQGKLKQGQFASATLVTTERLNVVSVLPESIREVAGRSFVYVISANNTLAEQDITLGARGTNSQGRDVIEVTKGLAAGTNIVASNLGPLRVGSPVQLRAAAKPNLAN
jgi:RND family efflux transporter MFP subunit